MCEIILQIIQQIISKTTIVEPTGVPETIATIRPVIAAITEITQEKIVTFLKLLNRYIEETGGKITRAEIKRVPTRFMERTITEAITDARIMFITFVFTPQAKEKFSSKVMANILL